MNNKTLNSAVDDNCIASSDTVSISNSNNIAELTLASTTSCVNCDSAQGWQPWSGSNKCPKCGSHHIEVNTMVVLTTHPAQSQLRCKDCDHYFSSGMFNSRNTNEDALDDYWKHDQSILNIPKVGDWPPSPQVGDAPWWPPEQEPPSYPDISIPSKDSPVGWICPKCGRCYAPHVSGCSHCNSSSIKITY
jgi:Zn finger protein HypA/HybF involved in hydrogenase expression